jgi:N-methylhydantoinase A
VSRGFDPRDFVVFAFGGAGPVHAGAFARQLGVRAVVIPIGNIASVLSAMGTVSSDVVHVHDRTTKLIAPFDMAQVEAAFAELEAEATAQLEAEGFTPADISIERFVSMKYGAQTFDLELPTHAGLSSEELVEDFEVAYEQRYGKGSGFAPAGIDLMRLRVQSSGRLPRPDLAVEDAARQDDAESTSRPVWWPEEGDWIETPIFDHAPAAVVGPAIVQLPDTTVPVRPDASLTRDDHGNLIMEFN